MVIWRSVRHRVVRRWRRMRRYLDSWWRLLNHGARHYLSYSYRVIFTHFPTTMWIEGFSDSDDSHKWRHWFIHE